MTVLRMRWLVIAQYAGLYCFHLLYLTSRLSAMSGLWELECRKESQLGGGLWTKCWLAKWPWLRWCELLGAKFPHSESQRWSSKVCSRVSVQPLGSLSCITKPLLCPFWNVWLCKSLNLFVPWSHQPGHQDSRLHPLEWGELMSSALKSDWCY